MKDTINDEKLLPSCIGLYGDWGSGKSSLMHMCKKQLEEQKDGTVCLLFNGWLYESYDDAKTAILASILDGIKECRELSGAAKITLKALYDSIDKFKVIKGGIKFGIDMAVTGGLGAITNLAIKEITKKAKKVAEDVDEETMLQEFGKGFSEDTLKNARKFYLTYKERISETVFSLFAIEKSETVFSFFEKEPPFIVSWSHYLQLMRIENEAERSFYEIETAKTGWGVRTLQRQYNSSLYERLALSRDKEGVLRLASEGNVITKPEDIIKQPTVLEFLGMEEKAKYSETDLETALINKLQKFLLELGKGYLFEARQKRFTYDEDNFYVDLVFYNRLLRCYVLIDLKVDKLTHQDIGQMQMYVNYYDRYEKLEDENPTIGILLCKEKNDALVEITLPKDANIYASEYKLYLPDKKLLQQKLKEWIEEEEEYLSRIEAHLCISTPCHYKWKAMQACSASNRIKYVTRGIYGVLL